MVSEVAGENEAYLIKYFPSEEYYNRLETNPHAPFVGGMNLQKIDPSSIGARIVGISCVTFTQVFCNFPKNGVQTEHPATENCTAEYIYDRSFTSCFISSVTEEQPERFVDISPGGGGGGGIPGNNNPVYPTPTNPVTPNPNTPQEPGLANPDGTGTIVSEPVLPVSMARVLGLNAEQKAWWNNAANADAVAVITGYLNENSGEESKQIARVLIDAVLDYCGEYGENAETIEISNDFIKSVLEMMMKMMKMLTLI